MVNLGFWLDGEVARLSLTLLTLPFSADTLTFHWAECPRATLASSAWTFTQSVPWELLASAWVRPSRVAATGVLPPSRMTVSAVAAVVDGVGVGVGVAAVSGVAAGVVFVGEAAAGVVAPPVGDCVAVLVFDGVGVVEGDAGGLLGGGLVFFPVGVGLGEGDDAVPQLSLEPPLAAVVLARMTCAGAA